MKHKPSHGFRLRTARVWNYQSRHETDGGTKDPEQEAGSAAPRGESGRATQPHRGGRGGGTSQWLLHVNEGGGGVTD